MVVVSEAFLTSSVKTNVAIPLSLVTAVSSNTPLSLKVALMVTPAKGKPPLKLTLTIAYQARQILAVPETLILLKLTVLFTKQLVVPPLLVV